MFILLHIRGISFVVQGLRKYLLQGSCECLVSSVIGFPEPIEDKFRWEDAVSVKVIFDELIQKSLGYFTGYVLSTNEVLELRD